MCLTRDYRRVVTDSSYSFGLSFLGKHFSEEKLISYAYDFEQRTKVRDRVSPYITPNIELQDIVGS